MPVDKVLRNTDPVKILDDILSKILKEMVF